MPIECPHCKGEVTQAEIDKRFKVLTDRAEAAEKASTAAEKLAQTHAALAEKAKTDLVEQLAAKDSEYATTIAFSEHGIKEPDIRDAFTWQFNKLPAENRPAFGEQLTAWKTKPEEAPVLLRPFLGAPAGSGSSSSSTGGTGSCTNTGAGNKAPPNTNAGTQTRTDGGGAFQAGSVVKSVGDGTYRANRDALYAAAGLGKPPPLPGGKSE